ncbi:DNA methyltransferase [Branchiibius cervicis]|uniref:DNA methyltransferase n=1 Tax=Branchiibius cervicis TaxID=908252 RepID=A0ABW2AT17_9MICO
MGLLISGDGLATMDRLRQIGVRPDLIYADPPFGTGRHQGDYADPSGQAWRDMIDRLVTAAFGLLPEHGSLWLHLGVGDGNRSMLRYAEQSALAAFGPSAHRTTIWWQRTASAPVAGTGFREQHDPILVLAKSPAFTVRRPPRTDDENTWFKSWDGDLVPWSSGDLTGPRGDRHPDLVYGIQSPFTATVHYPGPGRHWVYNRTEMTARLAAWGSYLPQHLPDAETRRRIVGSDVGDSPALMLTGGLAQAQRQATARMAAGTWPEVFFGRTGAGRPRRKVPLPATGAAPASVWDARVAGSVRDARDEVQRATGTRFATPKPEALLTRIIQIATDPDHLVFDPFAGSGVTAAVAHKLRRSWITCESWQSTLEQVTLPRLRFACAGNAPHTTTELVEPLPHKMLCEAPKQAAATLAALSDRLDVDPATIRRIRARLAVIAKTRQVEHRAPNEDVIVAGLDDLQVQILARYTRTGLPLTTTP